MHSSINWIALVCILINKLNSCLCIFSFMCWTCIMLYPVHYMDKHSLNLLFCSGKLRFYFVHYLDEHAFALPFPSSISWTSLFMVFSLFYSGKFRRYISASRDFICLESFNPLVDWLGRKYHGDVKFTQHFVYNINIVYR